MEALKGSVDGRYSIGINDQCRSGLRRGDADKMKLQQREHAPPNEEFLKPLAMTCQARLADHIGGGRGRLSIESRTAGVPVTGYSGSEPASGMSPGFPACNAQQA